jgi:hypothetical protein
VINAIKFSIEEIEASDQYFDHTPFSAINFRSRFTERSYAAPGTGLF